jgi:hypothetical protein
MAIVSRLVEKKETCNEAEACRAEANIIVRQNK